MTCSQIVAPFLAALVLFSTRADAAQQVQPLDDGPIHEAFVPPVTNVTALEAIEHEPPPELTERIPPKPSADSIWIKGYWAWDEGREDWVWVGGAWRRPPKARFWMDGFWLEADSGWVWIRGFWSPAPADAITYIDEPPPEAFDEDPPDAPGRNYFWLAGHWHYQPGVGYEPRVGHWEPLDPNWVLVPAHYVWRPDGYVYVTAYWDYPVDARGAVYQSVYVPPAARVTYVYEPVVIVQPTTVVTWCYYSYPNYVYVLHHHYHYHHDWWHTHHDVPTWWGWHTWWSLSWDDHWGVWWWYTNPGYHHPHFMTTSIAAHIHPPSQKTVIKVKNVVKKPVIVTNNGVISAGDTLQIAAKGKIKSKDGDRVKGGKSAPLVLAKGEKSKADEIAKKNVAKGGPESSVATIAPSGSKKDRSRDEPDDDAKKHPPKPKSNKSVDVVGRGAGKGSSTKAGSSRDAEKDSAKSRSGFTLPVSAKSKDKDGDKPKGGPPVSSKGKDDDDDKGKSKSKGTAPPITVKGKSDVPEPKAKGKDKDDDKSRDKPKPPPIVPSGGDKSKDKGGKPKELDPKKPSGLPPTPPPSITEPKPKDNDKPPKSVDKPPKPPGGSSGGGKGKDGKRKDKD